MYGNHFRCSEKETKISLYSKIVYCYVIKKKKVVYLEYKIKV